MKCVTCGADVPRSDSIIECDHALPEITWIVEKCPFCWQYKVLTMTWNGPPAGCGCELCESIPDRYYPRSKKNKKKKKTEPGTEKPYFCTKCEKKHHRGKIYKEHLEFKKVETKKTKKTKVEPKPSPGLDSWT